MHVDLEAVRSDVAQLKEDLRLLMDDMGAVAKGRAARAKERLTLRGSMPDESRVILLCGSGMAVVCQASVGTRLRAHAQPREQIAIPIGRGIGCGQQAIPVENRVGTGKKAQRLQLIRHFSPTG